MAKAMPRAMSKLIGASHALGAGDSRGREQEARETAGEKENVDPHGMKLRVLDGRKLALARVTGRGGKAVWRVTEA